MRGAGRVAPPYLTVGYTAVETVLPYNEADGNGGRIAFYPVPRFRLRNDTAKIQTVKGLRVEIFPRRLRKNTTRPLTV